MSQAGTVELVETDPTTQLLAAIAQDAAVYLDLLLPESIAAGRTARSRIRGLSIISVDNVGWELWFFNKRTTAAAPTPATSTFIGSWTFAAADAIRISGAGVYYYYIDGLDIPYEVLDTVANKDGVQVPDEADARRYLHLAVVARGAAKVLNAQMKLRVYLEGTLGR